MNILQDKDLLEFKANQESQTVCPAADFLEATIERVEQGVKVFGDPLPWEKTRDKFRFRPGELTIWAGVNGNGKSLVMGQAALWMLNYTSVLIASMEMKPEATMARMVRQAAGYEQPSSEFVHGFFNATTRLWIYDQLDTVESDRILAMCHWAATECGVKHIMIDSLVKCGIAPDDYARQKEFVDRLCWVAKTYNIHVHLVVHMRKGANETEIPDKFAVKGAGEITDLADNVLIIARNMKKEKLSREAQKDSMGVPLLPEDVATTPDGYLRVAKQRHGEWEGLWGFWWDENSHQW
ncbi:MAG: AAA family ATPase, partial [Ketobacter sp.]|nr:AAA family ATPase [Ketobacter sp.]